MYKQENSFCRRLKQKLFFWYGNFQGNLNDHAFPIQAQVKVAGTSNPLQLLAIAKAMPQKNNPRYGDYYVSLVLI